MSFKPVFQMPNDPKWCDNAQRFLTHHEALASANARFAVWTQPEKCDAHHSPDPVNYARAEGVDFMVNRKGDRFAIMVEHHTLTFRTEEEAKMYEVSLNTIGQLHSDITEIVEVVS